MRVLGDDPKAVIKKLRNRDDAIKTSKGIAPEVALYTKTGDLASASGKNKKGKQKDPESGNQEKARTCFLCKNPGDVKRNCSNKKDRSDRDGKASKDDKKETSNTANVATASTSSASARTDTLWITLAGPDEVYKSSTQIDASKDIFLDCACTRHVINRKDLLVTYLTLKEGVCEVQGFNQSRAYAKGVGKVCLPMRVPSGIGWVTLQNVLHVEESANLISQGRLMRRGLHLEVSGYGVKVYTPDGQLTACAPLVGLMLPFDIAWDAPEGNVRSFKATAREVGTGGAELKLWHRRYTHFGLEALKTTSRCQWIERGCILGGSVRLRSMHQEKACTFTVSPRQ
jgi:hypothetical protein